MQKPILSIGMIFKNEIRCLERCLKSLEPLRQAIPCELVMADTGSDDGSREIAEKYADILFDFPWIDDFAAARNAVIDRCTGKWFLSLDADEWFGESIEELIGFLTAKAVPYDYAGFIIRNFKDFNSADADNYNDFIARRIMRLSSGTRYTGCIHEHWKFPEGCTDHTVIRLEKTIVYHDGYAFISLGDTQAKYDRNIGLLKKKLAENPDDLQTLAECIDTTKRMDKTSAEYARHSLEVLHRDWEQWGRSGARVYRDAVSVAQFQKLPELRKWAEKALELYPNSIFTRVDVAYYAYAKCWDDHDVEEAIRWSELYRAGISDYRSGNFDWNESLQGTVELASPFWERRLLVMLVEAYLRVRAYDKAFHTFADINGAELDDLQQVEICANMLLRLHRETELDTSDLAVQFWEQINQPKPSADMAEKRRDMFINTAASSLTPHYRKDEVGCDPFIRHGYTALIPLDGKCILGTGAAVLDMSDAQEIEEKLSQYNIEELPISTLVHALKCGIEFPLPRKPLCVETMRALAQRLVPFEILLELAVSFVVPADEDIQALSWKRELLIASISSSKWNYPEQDWALVQSYVKTERQFLSAVYTNSMLTVNGSLLLPPLHRFGWYCAQAFDALESGDTAGYVHLLREGLALCEGMKDMVGFLVEHTEEVQAAMAPPPELQALANQVRAILARYDPNDPAVEALKQSEAYQKVAYLLERR